MDIRQCYRILEVTPEASVQEIQRHHRDLASVWHPDRFGENPRLRRKAEEKLAEINAAYDAIMAHIRCGRPDGADDFRTTGTRSDPNARAGCQTTAQPAARPRSPFKSVAFVMILGSVLVSSFFVLSKLDRIMHMIDHPAASLDQAVNRALNRFGPLPAETVNTGGGPAAAPADPTRPAARPAVRRYVEIHLTDGTILVGRTYRVEKDMIVCCTADGTLGVKKERVTAIRVRTAGDPEN